MESWVDNEKDEALKCNSPLLVFQDGKLTHWNYKMEIRPQMIQRKAYLVLNSIARYILEN